MVLGKGLEVAQDKTQMHFVTLHDK